MNEKKRDPFNEENSEFRVKPTKHVTVRAIKTMKYLGCKSRPAFLNMCIELGIRHYGEK